MRKFLLSMALVLLSGATMAQSYELTDTKVTSGELNTRTEATYIAIKNLSATNHYYFVGNTGAAPYSKADFTDDAVFIWEPVTEGEAGSYYLKKLDGTYMQTSSPKDYGDKANAAVFTTTNPTSTGSGSTKFNGDSDSQSYINGNDDTNLVRFVKGTNWINVQNGDSGTPTYNSGLGGWTIHHVYAVNAYAETVSVTYQYILNNAVKKEVTVVQGVGTAFNAPAVPYISFTYPEGNVTAETTTVQLECTVTTPFVAAENFESIEHWYYMTIRDDGPTYLQYDSEKEYIPATASAEPTSSKNSYTWGFVGNPFDGFEIVNYAAGDKMVLSAPSVPTGDKNAAELARMVTAEGAQGNTNWVIIPNTSTSTTNGFYVQHPTATTYALNRQTYNSANTVCYWDGRDTGSVLQVTEREMTNLASDLAALVATAEAQLAQITIGEGVGKYSSSFENYETAYNEIVEYSQNVPADATDEEIEEKIATLEAIMSSFSLNMPEKGKYYRFKGYNNDNYMLSDKYDNTHLAMGSGEFASAIFYYGEDGSLLSYANGCYLPQANSGGNWTCLEAGTAGPAATFAAGASKGAYGFYVGDNAARAYFSGRGTYVDAGGNIAANNGYDWVLEEVTELPVTVGEAGYATLFAPVALTVPAEVAAYTVAIDGEWAVLSNIGTTIPAETGVVLAATAGTYNLTITTTEWSASSELTGTVASTYVSANAYVLSQPEGEEVGFYVATTDGQEAGTFLNNGHKAYLPVQNAEGIACYSFRFGEGTTGIESVAAQNGANVIFDITGRKVKTINAAGIYIVNGKKVLVK